MGVLSFWAHKMGFFGALMHFSRVAGARTGLSRRRSGKTTGFVGSSRWQSLGESNPSLQVENLAS